MATIALVVHHDRPAAAKLARDTASWLAEQGHQVVLAGDDAVACGLDHLAGPAGALPDDVDLALSLGGDGTMLRAVDAVGAREVPVLGVELGQLSYLAEVEASDLRTALERFLRGEHQIEERMLLEIHVVGSGEREGASGGTIAVGRHLALNDAVVEKTASGHTVRLQVQINGRPFTPYTADGLIVATPTGSTAYNLSARGPIVDPTLRAILMTPVSPHMLFDRTLVLGAEAEIELTVGGTRPGLLSVDGRLLGTLGVGDRVVCRASPHSAHLVTFGLRDFHGILKAKFKLSDR